MGIADDMNSGANFIQNLYRGQMLRAQAGIAPQMAQNQLGMSNNDLSSSNINLQYLPQTVQSGIAAKNAYANLAPFQASASMDPITKMWYYQNVIMPAIKSGKIGSFGNNAVSPGGMPPGQAFSSGSSAPSNSSQIPIDPNNLQITSSDGGMTVQPSGSTGIAGSSGQPGGYPVLPGARPTPQQVSSLINGQAAGGQPTGIAGSPPDINQLYTIAQQMMMKQYGKNPQMGTNRGGAGGTFVDPSTGQTTSSDTTQQATRDQRAIAGLDNVNSYLNEAMKKMPQFVTGWQRAKLSGEGLANNWLGANYQAPSDYASGQAAIKESAEGFVNGFGLNATNENVDKAISIMTPTDGESPNGYKNRVAQQLTDFANQQQRAKSRLKNGIPVDEQLPSSQNINNNSTDTNSNNANTGVVKMPSFNSKQDFQKWYSGLPPAMQIAVKQQMGGK